MEDTVAGLYCILVDRENGYAVGKAHILYKIQNEFYYCQIFDLAHGEPEYQTVLHLSSMQELPFFRSQEELNLYFSGMPKCHDEHEEVSH